VNAPRYPTLYQINTRVRLAELAATLGRPASLDDIPDGDLDGLASAGFDLVWLLGVWQTGEAARRVSASQPDWLAEFRRVLPDLSDADICGSCFAVRDYHAHRGFGGDEALARLRERMRRRDLRLILDFVPNHVAPDHRWVEEHPEWLVAGSEAQLAAQPQNFCRLAAGGAPRIVAFGRDPNFPGWPDTLQLNYGSAALQDALLGELGRISDRCDGVRCDMAMLVLPEVFERTWGIPAAPFWPRATAAVKGSRPGFLFLAEAYWDLEWTLQQQGFDFCYDKRLYDRLEHCQARPVREHLGAGLDFQDRLARFLENHDEPRAAATFPPEVHRAAALITYLSPGLRFFHQGQLEGRRVRIPVHLGRGPAEPVDRDLADFYSALLACLRDPAFREGGWQLLEPAPAWDGNWSWDSFVCFAWTGPGGSRRLVAVNYADHRSQCRLSWPWPLHEESRWRLRELMGPAVYEREGRDLAENGLFLDLPEWGRHVFAVEEPRA
jgi:hypothetical protein